MWPFKKKKKANTVYDMASIVLTEDEGRREKPYLDSVGKITIGIGWNLEDNGLPSDLIDELFSRSYKTATDDVIRWLGEPVYKKLSVWRKLACLSMAFMGYPKLSQFTETKKAILKQDWELVCKEVLDSKWATQVKSRADRVTRLFLNDPSGYKWV